MRKNMITAWIATAALALGLSLTAATGASAAEVSTQPVPVFSCTGVNSGKLVWKTVNDQKAPVTITFQYQANSKPVPVGWSVNYTTSFKWATEYVDRDGVTRPITDNGPHTHYLHTAYNGVQNPARTAQVTAEQRATCK